MPRVVVESFSDYEAITVAGTAVGLTASEISGHDLAFISLESGQIRFRLDGIEPTASEGHILEIGDVLELVGSDVLANFKAIRTGSDSGTLRCSYGNA